MPVLLIALATSQIRAQNPAPMDMPVKDVPAVPTPSKDGAPVPAPSVAQDFAPGAGWPLPTDDHHLHSYILFDNLEYQRVRDGINALNWSIQGWRGGDVNRFWFKSEGFETSRLGVVGAQVDGQALYGRAISPFFTFQTGVRYETHLQSDRAANRVFAVVALQGTAPYRFDVEPELFLSNKGKVSGRFTASTDWLLTQRLILQPRIETEFAFQSDSDFGIDRGFNDAGASMRMRYELRREFAPYVGIGFLQDFGATQSRSQKEGTVPNQLQFIFGIRLWH
jgi:copper resistance protein B